MVGGRKNGSCKQAEKPKGQDGAGRQATDDLKPGILVAQLFQRPGIPVMMPHEAQMFFLGNIADKLDRCSNRPLQLGRFFDNPESPFIAHTVLHTRTPPRSDAQVYCAFLLECFARDRRLRIDRRFAPRNKMSVAAFMSLIWAETLFGGGFVYAMRPYGTAK